MASSTGGNAGTATGSTKSEMLDFYKEEVKAEDQLIRLSAIKRTRYVAHAIGPKLVHSDLVPFLFECTKLDMYTSDDEFLFRAACTYIELMDHISGSHQILVAPLEWLSYQEETVIRDKAIEGLGLICAAGKVDVPNEIFPVLIRLCTAEWFTARLSVCALFSHVYTRCTDQQKEEMRKAYTTLCTDETPMVRRSAAMRLKDFVAVLDKQNTITDMIPVYKQLSQDDTQDAIRVACVKVTLVLLSTHFKQTPEENKVHTIGVITAASEDRSWRVRLTVAQNYDKICACMNPELISAFLLNPFVALIKDSEQEVRSATVCIIGRMVKQDIFTSEQLQNYIVPQFQGLALDSSPLVRAALANIISLVAEQLGRDLTQKLLLASISDLMKDEYHDVRLNIVSHAAEICVVLGLDVLAHSLLTTIQSLIMDNQWRIRKSVIQQIPELSKQFGTEMFQTKLESLFLSSLSDSVHAVRAVAIQNMRIICENFGKEWTVDHLMPKIIEQYASNTGFSTRLTILHALPNLAVVMTPEQIGALVIPMLIRGVKDTVPNVRFCACKVLANMSRNGKLSGPYVSGTVKPAVTEMLSDADTDVVAIATKTLEILEKSIKA